MSNLKKYPIDASQAFLNGQINKAIEIISSAITSSENVLNDHDMSVLFAIRASYYNLSKKFLDALTDSETAISLDTHNVRGHVQKSKTFFHLHKVKEAREAMHVGRGVANDHGLFDELEKLDPTHGLS